MKRRLILCIGIFFTGIVLRAGITPESRDSLSGVHIGLPDDTGPFLDSGIEGTSREFTTAYLGNFFKVEPRIDSLLRLGEKLFRELEEEQLFIEKLMGKELVALPVGLKKELSPNTVITLGLISSRLYPDYAEVDLFARLELGELGIDLMFAGSGLKFSHQGGLIGEARLVLLRDIPVIQHGGRWLFTLLGGFKTNGLPADESFITISCDGEITGVSIMADIRLSKTIALPLNEDGELKYPGQTQPADGVHPVNNQTYVGARMRIEASSFEDLLLELDLPLFGIPNLPGWGFSLRKCVLDLSDKRNSPQLEFPKFYAEHQLLDATYPELWRGFYARELEILLPAEFRIRDQEERIRVGARNLLIDQFGVSGAFFIQNVLGLEEGNAGGWQFSVDELSLSLISGHLASASFTGKLLLPVTDSDPNGRGALGYTGMIAANNRYSLKVETGEDLSFDLFRARARLFPDSYVLLEAEQGKFYPSAHLSGLLTLSGNDSETAQTDSATSQTRGDLEGIELPGLIFRDLAIESRKAPYLSVRYLGIADTMALPKIYGFQMGIHNVVLRTDQDKAELRFNTFIHLDETGIRGDLGLAILGRLEQGDLMRYRYERTQLERVEVEVSRKGFEFNGALGFFRDHPVYGNGLEGELQLYARALKLRMQAKGVFGNTGDFRYWYVDAFGQPDQQEQDAFRFHQLGGGLYHHMRKAGAKKDALSLSGVHYEPDQTVSYGFKAVASFELKKAGLFTGITALEMSFLDPSYGGGVDRLVFYGAASLMNENSGVPGFSPFGTVEDMQYSLAEREAALRGIKDITLDRQGVRYFAQEVFPDVLSGKEIFGAQLAIDFDFSNEIYWGLFDTFLNAGGIRGDGEKNRLGYLEFFSSPRDWYVYVGTPERRIGVRDIPVGALKARMNLYFMTGTILPPASPPPAQVVNLLNLKGDETLFHRNFESALAQGTGYSFGAEFGLGIGVDWGMIYASAQAGVGFDLFMRNFGQAGCTADDGRVGLNGWYATGQLYAYLQGKIGLRFHAFGLTHDIPILQAGIAVLAQGQLPNPWFIKGYAGVQVRALGVTVRSRLKIVLGTPCEFIERSAMDSYAVISDVLPASGQQEVSVFESVQVALNFPEGKPISLTDQQQTRSYKVVLDDFMVLHGQKKVKGKILWNTQRDQFQFQPDDILPEQSELIVVVRMGFREFAQQQWQTLYRQGIPLIEEKRVAFTTGAAPLKIPLSNVEMMYPVAGQQYLLPEESPDGFVQLRQGQDYLFDEGNTYRLNLEEEVSGKPVALEFRYDQQANRISFSLPGLARSSSYKLRLVLETGAETSAQSEQVFTSVGGDTEISTKKLSGSASAGHQWVLLEFPFKTSQFRKFREKIAHMQVVRHLTFADGASDVGGMALKLRPTEPFDVNEVLGTPLTGGVPMLTGKGTGTDTYFTREINPLLYGRYPFSHGLTLSRSSSVLGVPPMEALYPSSSYVQFSGYDPDNANLREYFPLQWHLAREFKRDYLELQQQLAKLIFGGDSLNVALYEVYREFLETRFPYLNSEDYQVELQYRVPGAVEGHKTKIDFTNSF